MKTTKEIIEDIERIIYWVRRYGGVRDLKESKIWKAVDLDLLQMRIKAYLKRPSRFNFDNPNMDIESY